MRFLRDKRLLIEKDKAVGFWGMPGEVIRTVNRWMHAVLLVIADVALVAMIAITFYTVVLRYCFNTGLGWAEEVPRLLVVLFSFLACAIGTRDHMHVSVNIVYNFLPQDGKARRALLILTDVCTLVFGYIVMVYGYTYMTRLMRVTGTLPMTGMRTWVQYLPMPFAGFVITFDSLLFLLRIVKPDDLLYSSQEVDYMDQMLHDKSNAEPSDETPSDAEPPKGGTHA